MHWREKLWLCSIYVERKNVRKFYIKSGPRGELGQRGTRQPRIGNRGHFRLAMIKDMSFY